MSNIIQLRTEAIAQSQSQLTEVVNLPAIDTISGLTWLRHKQLT